MWTEDEALGKWCSFAMVPHPSGVASNRWMGDDGSEQGARCLGSGCTHWAYVEGPLEGREYEEAFAQWRDFERHEAATRGENIEPEELTDQRFLKSDFYADLMGGRRGKCMRQG